MEYFYFALGVIAVAVIIFVIINRHYHSKVAKIVQALEKLGDLKKADSSSYHYDLTIAETIYQIKIINTYSYQELSFNSNSHWQLKPSKKIKLISPGGFDKRLGVKIIIPLNTPAKIVKYLNENEIAFVEPLEKCFSYYLITKENISFIKRIKKEA
ncbi:MAG: hypothetical protein RBS76_01095 [Acholeplasmatales bacterium]|jgi:hypothetical protein|nr:hypothetical protein [Acholeplasmataceae bacterium]MDY0115076.1 hypothetical protein [Acholeplasmatales bacterium]MCK9233917.1 hypothetical protein [Acholeplasmataceae bacterium]MCK9289172.1 hypothetical protein [Acholeplasmataceae bacterium]MCK9427064.1 hypothetical protein [Acholeplasmataceae bacterium]